MPLSTIFDDKLRPQILSVGTTANSPLRETEVIEQKTKCRTCKHTWV